MKMSVLVLAAVTALLLFTQTACVGSDPAFDSLKLLLAGDYSAEFEVSSGDSHVAAKLYKTGNTARFEFDEPEYMKNVVIISADGELHMESNDFSVPLPKSAAMLLTAVSDALEAVNLSVSEMRFSDRQMLDGKEYLIINVTPDSGETAITLCADEKTSLPVRITVSGADIEAEAEFVRFFAA